MENTLDIKKDKRNFLIMRSLRLTIKYIVLVAFAVFLLFPYFFMLSKSFMDITEINSVTPKFFPSALKFTNYKIVSQYMPYIYNSLVICLINGIFIPFTAMMVAYPFARHKFKGKKILFSIMMSTVMIPGIVLSVPSYIMFSAFGLVDTVASQWISAFWGGGAINTFLFMQFMRVLPKSYEDAAVIDGANKWDIFIKIMFPLCKNVFIFIAIGTIIGRWSDFQGPLIYLSSQKKFTIAVAFYYEFSSSGTSSLLGHYKMAMAVTMTLFPAILFFIFQDSMIGGIQIGGVKG